MKSGNFADFTAQFSCAALDRMTHLFIAKNADSIECFPDRVFEIIALSSLNKKEFKRALAGIPGGVSRANIAVRNFPMSADELRKRLKLKDGGEIFIFGTTVLGEHRILVCRRR